MRCNTGTDFNSDDSFISLVYKKSKNSNEVCYLQPEVMIMI